MLTHRLRLISIAGLLPAVLVFLPPRSLFGDGGPEDSGTVSATVNDSVTWTGDGTAGGSAGEDTCGDVVSNTADANCDQFQLTVAPGDYTGKLIHVEIHWTLPATDYDLYIHKGDVNGPIVASSGSGAPSTNEAADLSPSASGTGLYTVHVVYFSAFAGDQYSGSATTKLAPVTRTATYINGATLNPPLAFSPNKPLKAPVTNSDGEPSNRTDIRGNAYICGIRGFPAGVDLWYYNLQPGSNTYDPNARNPLYRFQPDAFSPDQQVELGGDGGGDVDLAVGFGSPAASPGAPPFLAYSSLIAANLSTGNSLDRAMTYHLNPAGNLTGGLPANDRQWHAAYGTDSVYLLYRELDPPQALIHRSNDDGFSYGPATVVGLLDVADQTGGIDVNQKTGTVYASFSSGQVAVGDPPPLPVGAPPIRYDIRQATPTSDVGHLFCTVKVAEGTNANLDGVVYVAYSDDHNIYLVHSTDKGVTWSAPVRVSNLPGGGTNIFPWIEVGSGATQNSVGVVWYGTQSVINNDSANWKVYYAFSSNATAAKPTFYQVPASDHFIHASNISEGGLTGSANRNLLDYFQVSFDTVGAAVIGYTDDHNDFFGNCYGTRQISGPNIKGGNVPAPVENGQLTRGSNPDVQPPQQPGPNGEQVMDFANDVGDALLFRLPPGPRDSGYGTFDVRSIKYSSGHNNTIGDYIEVVMKTGDIDPTTDASWRMNFAVNAPFSTLSASKDLTTGQSDYTYGLSDRGDQFYVRADAAFKRNVVNRTYTWGTAVRNSDGSITYTPQGSPEFGQVLADGHNSITIRISFAQLNTYLAQHGRPLIGHGTVLVGLRGSAFTTQSSAGRSDFTYGGTQYKIP